MSSQVRREKIAASIQKEVSQILQYQIKDHRIAEHFMSITRVDVTGDLRYAKIFLSLYNNESLDTKQMILNGLESAQGYIRSELSQRLSLRYTPELIFKLDGSLQEGAKMLELIDQLRAEGQMGEQEDQRDESNDEQESTPVDSH